MLRTPKIAIVLALGALVAACASSGPRPLTRERFERAIAGAPGAAQPSRIVARELEFARAAKDNGQWTAFREFAAPSAIIHGRNGPIVASTWLAAQDDPEEAVRWSPRAVWMSCDGRLAVSNGRFRDPEGMVGNFVTVWQRQRGGEYLWTYDAAVRDDPQPPERDALPEAIGEDEIVVSAVSSIKGLVADCARRGEAGVAPPTLTAVEGASSESQTSRDGTLRWRWEHRPGDDRRFVAEYLTSGAWEVALDQNLGAANAAEVSQN